MGNERDKGLQAAGAKGWGWIDIKSILATMLITSFILVVTENLLRYSNRAACSVAQRESSAKLTPIPELLGTRGAENVGHCISGCSELAAAVPEPELPRKLNVTGRHFHAYGSAASVFVEFGTYRGGANSFAVVGLTSKPLIVYGKPEFECDWMPSTESTLDATVQGRAEKMLPDWGYGRVYTVVVVNCTFEVEVGTDGKGGRLILQASHGDGQGKRKERIHALLEKEGDYRAGDYKPPYPYDFVYCGSSLFGGLNSERIREWMAYHVRLLGSRSHFVFYDAGGVSASVEEALRPWQQLGFVTIHDITQQRLFDSYYHNQFLIVNDCLHRTRFLANWTFFFDVDEYLYVRPQDTLHSVMASFSRYTQITFEQNHMSPALCQNPSHNGSLSRLWGFEKLTYRNIRQGVRRDRKYAIQARNVFATGVNISKHMKGKSLHTRGPEIKYYHYHNSIAVEGELCQEFATTNSTSSVVYSGKDPFKLDIGMQYLAQTVKNFELQQIGPHQ